MQQKWFAQSITIWGVIVGFINNYWSVIDSFLGTGITLEAIAPALDGVREMLHAIGNLVSAIMIIVGRFRADTKLTFTKPAVK